MLAVFARAALSPVFPIAMEWKTFGGVACGVLAVPLAFHMVGLYPGTGLTAVQRLRYRYYAVGLVFTALILWNYAVAGGQWSRGVLVIAGVLTLIISPLADSAARHLLMRRGWGATPVYILGAGETGQLVARIMRRDQSLGYLPVGFFDDDPAKQREIIEEIPVLGRLHQAKSTEGEVKTVVLAMPRLERLRMARLIHELDFPNVIVILDLLGIQSLWVEPFDVGGMLGFGIRKNLLIRRNRILKRILDLALGIPLLIVVAPVIAVAAVFVKLADRGPALFTQEREGMNGRQMRILKLRTMYADSEAALQCYFERHPTAREEWLRYFKLKDDPRILPYVGKTLRRFSLDELPQLWHVVRGDMSFVGPRPFPQYHIERFSREFRELRSSVKPGLTGLWQVSARSDGDLLTQEAQDTYYIRNWSLWLDFYILARTFKAVLSRRGAY
jgi:Undecaprenyl-phosphate galactose phosphotransferase WbaP